MEQQLSSERNPEGDLHTIWDLPSSVLAHFRTAKHIFEEVGFGSLEMTIIGEPDQDQTVAITLARHGAGKPAVFAEYLAAQAYYLNEKDPQVTGEQTQMVLKDVAQLLTEDQNLINLVMQRSIGGNVEKTE